MMANVLTSFLYVAASIILTNQAVQAQIHSSDADHSDYVITTT